MAVNRYYSSTAVDTTLASSMSSGDTTLVVSSTQGFPTSYPYTLAIGYDTSAEELVNIVGAAGTTLTVGTTVGVASTTGRAVDGTQGGSGVAHAAGAVVKHVISGRDMREAQEHIAATTSVHGIADTSNLATLTSPTFTGTVVLPSTTSIGSVSSTEIGYVDGVTSAIQTQLNQAKLTVQATAKTAGYTLASGDEGSLIKLDATSSAITVTVPTDATFNFAVGTQINLLSIDSTSSINIAAASGATIVGTPGLKLRAQWSSATVIKIASNSWVVVGDLTA